MIIQPKGRGWSAIVTEKTSREIGHLLNSPTAGTYDEISNRDHEWIALRKKVSHGPAVAIRKAL